MKKPIIVLLTALTMTASSAAVASANTNCVPTPRPQVTNVVQNNQHKVEQLIAQMKDLDNRSQPSRQIQDQINLLEKQIQTLIGQNNNYYNYPLSIRNDIDTLRNKGHFKNWVPEDSENPVIAQTNQYNVEQLIAQLKSLINEPQSLQIQEQINLLEKQIQTLIDQDNDYYNYPLSIRNDIDALRSKGDFKNWTPKNNNRSSNQDNHRNDNRGNDNRGQNDRGQNDRGQNDHK